VSERIEKLKAVIETMHHCTARHLASEPVTELLNGEVAWDGVVEVFDIRGFPEASRCYAWSYVEDREPHYVTAFEIPPVDSAKTAVKIAISAKAK
jgi:hypothetical protein